MRVRKMDANGDIVFGGGQTSFYRDQPEAPAQCVLTRLQLYTGEWFADTSAGTPWRTQVLGKYTAPIRDQVLRARILGTTGVTSIATYSSTFDPNARAFSVASTINTAYGAASIAGPI